MAYKYLKEDWNRIERKGRKRWGIVGLLLVGGVGCWMLVIAPLLKYQFLYASSWEGYLTPVSGLSGGSMEIEEDKVESGAKNVESTWEHMMLNEAFPEVAGFDSGEVQYGGVEYYRLAIPELKIGGARVKIGGEDLSQYLIHYQGTALPGKVGNAVVFGHSVLPQFFNPENYMTIFSTLHRLEEGSEIVLSYDGIDYRYQVVDMYEVKPNDLSVLHQSTEDSYLILITCSPPGTYLRRLVVQAKLMPW